MANPYDNASNKVSVLGPTLVFKGELSADEDLLLRGRVEGSIDHTASLRIGEEGSVKGNIKAKYVAVEGQVEGDIQGGDSVTVKASARVVGNLFAPTVSLVEGAHFKGTIDMDQAAGQSKSSRPQEDRSEAQSEITPKVAAGASK